MHMQSIVKTALLAGSTALEIANIGGSPFAGSVAALIGELGRSCEQVKMYKSHCRSLVDHAQIILDALQGGTSGLEGTELQAAADELEMILQQISDRMSKWVAYSLIKSWLRRDEISDHIQQTEQRLKAHLEKFNIKIRIETFVEVRKAESIRRRDQEETREALDNILMKQDNILKLLEMRLAGEPAAEQVMEAAQKEFHMQPRDTPRYFAYEKNVYNLYNTTGVMPTLQDLSHEVKKLQGEPVAGGTYSDVWLGTWLGHVEVALKALRGVKVSDRALRKFGHEISVWHTLEHPHVLRFLGVVSKLGPHILVVSPWQSNGNALEYVKNHPDVNRLKLLTGAARGVEYLHSRELPVVHGNSMVANILISDEGEALISDFGLSRVIGEVSDTAVSITVTSTGSIRWSAPEVLNDTVNFPTLESDVYSFAMAILECLTSEKPFAHQKRDTAVVIDVVANKRGPRRPSATAWERWFSEELWGLLESCWSHDFSSRPQMKDVAARLQLCSETREKSVQKHS